jgi:hypothetical protein
MESSLVPSVEMVNTVEPITLVEIPVLKLETINNLVEEIVTSSLQRVITLNEELPVESLVEEMSAEKLNTILEESVTTLETMNIANPLVKMVNTELYPLHTPIIYKEIGESTIPVFVPQHIELTDQDVKQKISVFSTLVLELYRMLTSSLLILFVPQSCKGQLCSIYDNVKWNPNHHVYNLGICVNFITLFTFSCLYYIELKRENRLIKYLDVNPDMPSSNNAVEKTLEHISVEKKNKILSIDKQYQRVSYLSIGMFLFNSVISGLIVNRYYLGSQTTTSLITSLLFMFTKLLNVYQVCNTEEHIFYSSYIKTFVQFNDLDKKHKELL